MVQGVQLSLGHDGATLAPTRKRLNKILGVQENRLTPETAHRLAGKLNLCEPDSLRKGGATPIYARSGAHSGDKSELMPGLRAALLATAALLQQVPPRLVPFTAPQAVNCVVYADAFFLEGELRHKAGWVPANAPMAHPHRSANGWGYVVRVGDIAWYDCGSVPAWFVRKFDTRRAHIYMLEVLAQILAVVTLADILGEDWVAFIDNAAGQWALNKGYGRDPSVNGLLSAFWSLAAMHSWRPTFYRVTSEANIADPISRADCTLAIRLGWKQAETPLDRILEILAWAADDLEYAVHRAASDLSTI